MSHSLSMRILHFDMKAMISRAHFMLELLPEISAMGYNALLVEFEDKFPALRMFLKVSLRQY